MGFSAAPEKWRGLGIGLEAEIDYSNRSGTIDGAGDAQYRSGQLGENIILSF